MKKIVLVIAVVAVLTSAAWLGKSRLTGTPPSVSAAVATAEKAGRSGEAPSTRPVAPAAGSFQQNVTQQEVPFKKPGSKYTFHRAFEVGCRVFNNVGYAGGTAYFDCGSEDAIIAVDIASGQEKWRFKPGEFVTDPVFREGLVFAVGEHNIYAIDPATGKRAWQADAHFNHDSMSPPQPAVQDRRAYIMGVTDCQLHVLDARTGQPRWDYSYCDARALPAAQTSTSSSRLWIETAGLAAPVVAGDKVYLTTSVYDGPNKRAFQRIHAIDIVTHHEVWSHDFDQMMLLAPVIDGGRLFVVDMAAAFNYALSDSKPATHGSSAAVCLDAATGKELWSFRVSEALSDFAASNGVLVLSSTYDLPSSSSSNPMSGGRVYGLDAATGNRLWSFDTTGEVKSSVFIAGGGAIFESWTANKQLYSNHIYARDLKTGGHRWELRQEDAQCQMPDLKLVEVGTLWLLSQDDQKSGFWRVQ